jgi:hypothetical protein
MSALSDAMMRTDRTGTKADAGKVPMHLIAPEVLGEWARRNSPATSGTKQNARDALAQLTFWWQRGFNMLRVDDGWKREQEFTPLLDALDEVVDWFGVARVLEFGAQKYAPRNWEKGIAFARVYGAACRHLLAFIGGEEHDPETGYCHLDHASCCIMFLAAYQMRGMNDLDDRPSPAA